MTTASADRSATTRRAPPRVWPLPVLLLLFGLAYLPDLGRARMLGWDEAEYASLGRDLLQRHRYESYGEPEAMRLPVVPLLVAGAIAIAPHAGDAAPRAAGLATMLLAIAVVWLGVARATDRVTATAAALWFGAMPLIQVLATLVLSEASFIAAFGAAVWCFHDGLGGRPRSYLACALAIGIAALTRYVAALFVPIAVLMLLAHGLAFGGRELARRTIGTAAFRWAPLLALAVTAPWLMRETMTFQNPFEGVRESWHVVSEWGREPWSWYLARLPLTAGWPVLAAAALGVVIAVRTRSRAAVTAAIVCAVVLVAHSRYPHKEDRYISAMLPFLATLAAIGLARGVARPLARLLGARLAPLLAPALALAMALAGWNGAATRALDLAPAGHPSLTDAMAAVRAGSAPGDTVLGASGPLLRWYGERPVRPMPQRRGEFDAALHGVAWVVFVNYERMQPDWAPDLTRAMTAADAARGDVQVFRSGPFQTVIARAPVLAAHLAGGDDRPPPR